MQELRSKIVELIFQPLKEFGLVLVELKIFRNKRGVTLRFLIDRPTGGITVDECARFNERINHLLDEKQLIEESYILEVSSPGVDRPLVSADDFSRVVGRKVKVFFKSPVKNKMELAGTIEKIEDENISLLVESECVQVPINNITKGKQTL